VDNARLVIGVHSPFNPGQYTTFDASDFCVSTRRIHNQLKSRRGCLSSADSPANENENRSESNLNWAGKWPSYHYCLSHAPKAHSGDNPDVSRADFTWALTAIDWGWSVEETAARLMEESPKARENGRQSALFNGYKCGSSSCAPASIHRAQPITRLLLYNLSSSSLKT
jgi:hypothetical protein